MQNQSIEQICKATIRPATFMQKLVHRLKLISLVSTKSFGKVTNEIKIAAVLVGAMSKAIAKDFWQVFTSPTMREAVEVAISGGVFTGIVMITFATIVTYGIIPACVIVAVFMFLRFLLQIAYRNE